MIVRVFLSAVAVSLCISVSAGADWPQLKYDSRRSGNQVDGNVQASLGLVASVRLNDAIFTSPVVADGRVFVVDGSGNAYCFSSDSLAQQWRFSARSDRANCNHVCSPAYIDRYLHFGTMDGSYFVLNAETGDTVAEIRCGEPIFSSPVVANGRVYFATLGSKIYAVQPDGDQLWQWDYVKEKLGFTGDRWDGAQWEQFKQNQRMTPREQFHCSREIAAIGKRIVVPTGGTVTWLTDKGDRRICCQH